MKVKFKGIFKRVGSLFALILVLVPLLVLGASAADYEKPPMDEINGSLDIGADEAFFIMEGLSKFPICPLYGNDTDFRTSVAEYRAVYFSAGYTGMFGDKATPCKLDPRYIRNLGQAFYSNDRYGEANWMVFYAPSTDSEFLPEMARGSGTVYTTIDAARRVAVVTLFNVDRAYAYDRVELVYYLTHYVDDNIGYVYSTAHLVNIKCRAWDNGGIFEYDAQDRRVWVNLGFYVLKAGAGVPYDMANVPSYTLSALLGFGIDSAQQLGSIVEFPYSVIYGAMSGTAYGEQIGYQDGYSAGVVAGQNAVFESENMLWKFVVGLFDAPAVLIQSMTNFDLFGVNVFSLIQVIFGVLVTILVVAIVIAVITKFMP